MPDKLNLDLMLKTAISAARQAGTEALNNIKNAKSTLKKEDEIVTQIDLHCQNIIINQIRNIFPDDGFLAEEGENGELFKTPPASSSIWWVIDPIDGTNNYSRSIFSFTVSIAAFQNGLPIIGVIYDPNTDNVFSVSKDTKPCLNGQPITVSKEGISRFASIAIDSHWPNGIPTQIADLLRVAKFRNFGTTALHLAYVSSGAFVGSITNTIRLWDIAAGAFLITKAGGIITDWQGNQLFPIDLESYNGEKFSTLATNKATYDELLKILKNIS